MRAYNTEVPIMAYAVYPRARTQALEELIQILLENGGELELGDAVQQLSSQNRSLVLHYGAFEFVDSHPELFKCEEVRTLRKHKSKVVIILNVPLEFCFEAGEKGGCVTRKCTRLHLCPFFIKGNCKFGATCNRSHSYGDEHTVRVLMFFLAFARGFGKDRRGKRITANCCQTIGAGYLQILQQRYMHERG